MEKVNNRLDEMTQKLDRLEAVINVIAEHIEVLEKRSEKFTDKLNLEDLNLKSLVMIYQK